MTYNDAYSHPIENKMFALFFRYTFGIVCLYLFRVFLKYEGK
jgi:hypothetical protein